MDHCIVCATRGGQGSRAVQLEAVRRAKASGNTLVFLYVLETNAMGPMEQSLLNSVRAELTWLGKALVNAARLRARGEDVDAEVVIREGDVREEICRFLDESKASLLLLGAPRGTTTTIFGDDAAERFARIIQRETKVMVEIVRPDFPKDAD